MAKITTSSDSISGSQSTSEKIKPSRETHFSKAKAKQFDKETTKNKAGKTTPT